MCVHVYVCVAGGGVVCMCACGWVGRCASVGAVT